MSSATGMDVPLEARVRVMQIVKIALVMGVTAFAGFVISRGPPAKVDNDSIVWVLGMFGGMTILARLFVPTLVVRSGLRRIASGTWMPANRGIPGPTTDEGRLALLYQTQMIVGSALLEGGAFANLVPCLTTGHPFSWAMTGILWLGMVVDFPTRLRVERWIESKLAWIRDERTLQGLPR